MDFQVPKEERRRTIGISEDRIFTMLEDIRTKLDNLVRLEERTRHQEENHARLVATYKEDKIKQEAVNDTLAGRINALENSSTKNASLIGVAVKMAAWCVSLLIAMGVYDGVIQPVIREQHNAKIEVKKDGS